MSNDNTRSEHEKSGENPNSSHFRSDDGMLVTEALAPLVVQGLSAAGFEVRAAQIAGTYVDAIADKCIAEGEPSSARLGLIMYLRLLIAIIMVPSQWHLDANSVESMILERGKSWYIRWRTFAEYSATRAAETEERVQQIFSESSRQASGAFAPGRIQVEKAPCPPPIDQSRKYEAVITRDQAAWARTLLHRFGYPSAGLQIENTRISVLAKAVEPEDPVMIEIISSYLYAATDLDRIRASSGPHREGTSVQDREVIRPSDYPDLCRRPIMIHEQAHRDGKRVWVERIYYPDDPAYEEAFVSLAVLCRFGGASLEDAPEFLPEGYVDHE